ncbi:serine protease-like protein [Meiothermus phage MMP17]|nr:serine protease-like protein [Meiothermus phage MMP17]
MIGVLSAILDLLKQISLLSGQCLPGAGADPQHLYPWPGPIGQRGPLHSGPVGVQLIVQGAVVAREHHVALHGVQCLGQPHVVLPRHLVAVVRAGVAGLGQVGRVAVVERLRPVVLGNDLQRVAVLDDDAPQPLDDGRQGWGKVGPVHRGVAAVALGVVAEAGGAVEAGPKTRP